MKNNAILRIVLYSILIAVLVGILGMTLAGWVGIRSFDLLTGMTVVSEEGQTAPDGVVVLEELNTAEVAVEGITEIKIEWVAGNVTVQPGDVEAIRFSETGGEKPMAYKVEGSELVIQFMEGKWTDIVGRPLRSKKDLTVTVPRDWAGQELSIEAVEADVQVVELKLDELEFDGVSGRFEAENCQIRKMDMETVSGNIRYSGSLEELDVDSVSADCTLTLSNIPSSVEMDGVSGSLDMTLPDEAGLNVRLQSASGKLTTDFEGTRNGKSFVSGDGACRVEVNGVSGNVRIHRAG